MTAPFAATSTADCRPALFQKLRPGDAPSIGGAARLINSLRLHWGRGRLADPPWRGVAACQPGRLAEWRR